MGKGSVGVPNAAVGEATDAAIGCDSDVTCFDVCADVAFYVLLEPSSGSVLSRLHDRGPSCEYASSWQNTLELVSQPESSGYGVRLVEIVLGQLWWSARRMIAVSDDVVGRLRRANSYPAEAGGLIAESYFDLVRKRSQRRFTVIWELFDRHVGPDGAEEVTTEGVSPWPREFLVEYQDRILEALQSVLAREDFGGTHDLPNWIELNLRKEYLRSTGCIYEQSCELRATPNRCHEEYFQRFKAQHPVYELILQGLSNGQIAKRLGSTPDAVKQTRHRLKNAGFLTPKK